MSIQPKAGEMLVGAYLKHIEDCDFIDYQKHGRVDGKQAEVDVVGLKLDEEPEIYVAEVVTHLRGMRYNRGEPNSTTLERKFKKDEKLVTSEFGNQHTYNFQLWSPSVRPTSIEELHNMASDFKRRTGEELDLVINEKFTEEIAKLRTSAKSNKSQGNELAFRFLQILEEVQE